MQKMMDFAGKMDLSNFAGSPFMNPGLFNLFGSRDGQNGKQDDSSAKSRKGSAGNSRGSSSGAPGEDDAAQSDTLSVPEGAGDSSASGQEYARDPSDGDFREVTDDSSPEDVPVEIEIRVPADGMENPFENIESFEEDDEDEDTGEKSGGKSGRKGPSISFLNLGDLFGNGGGFGQGGGPKVKKKKKNARTPVLYIDNIPAPHKIKEELNK